MTDTVTADLTPLDVGDILILGVTGGIASGKSTVADEGGHSKATRQTRIIKIPYTERPFG
jgi:hypothetical protein